MTNRIRRTKIVATIGPASCSPKVMRELMKAGMNVARLNFSHGNYQDHEQVVKNLRAVSDELGIPMTIMQDLQGPKIRVGKLISDEITLKPGEKVILVPEAVYHGQPATIPLDYSYVAEEARPGMQVLMADGLFELEITAIKGDTVECVVKEGGILKSRKGVNFPDLNLRLPSLTEKDIRDLEFGLTQDIDWISLSFVRCAEDVKALQGFLESKGNLKPVIAKIEKPQALDHLEEIIRVSDGIMVARGDLGVEINPERVPMIQKKIIEQCNRKGIPVITATQMLESMIHEPRPTRAEASDVANAIIDGTDAVMLSGESAIGDFPVKAVEMMARIACEVESKIDFKVYPPAGDSDVHALSQAANGIEKILNLKCIVSLTTSGKSAQAVASERPKTPLYALTSDLKVYHSLNLFWGITPVLISEHPATFEALVACTESVMKTRGIANPGDKIMIVAGIPANHPGGTNFLKIHTL
ncbi:MAG: pyruvate kinase [Bacteroidetes bacterium]|nr:pyruvate kinase [Bacteroidota bacterium]